MPTSRPQNIAVPGRLLGKRRRIDASEFHPASKVL
jgi:hypothetical protein